MRSAFRLLELLPGADGVGRGQGLPQRLPRAGGRAHGRGGRRARHAAAGGPAAPGRSLQDRMGVTFKTRAQIRFDRGGVGRLAER